MRATLATALCYLTTLGLHHLTSQGLSSTLHAAGDGTAAKGAHAEAEARAEAAEASLAAARVSLAAERVASAESAASSGTAAAAVEAQAQEDRMRAELAEATMLSLQVQQHRRPRVRRH
jgi:hypothetical protein